MKDEQQLVEAVARAMLAASRPSVNPDDLTPAPRGQLGMMPKWRLYEHLATAALSILKPEIEAMREAARAAFHEALSRYPDAAGALTFFWVASGLGEAAPNAEQIAWAEQQVAALNGGPTNAGEAAFERACFESAAEKIREGRSPRIQGDR